MFFKIPIIVFPYLEAVQLTKSRDQATKTKTLDNQNQHLSSKEFRNDTQVNTRKIILKTFLYTTQAQTFTSHTKHFVNYWFLLKY